VHTALLAAGIPILEHLCGLDQLPPSGFRFHAAPPRLVGIGTFPVRAYAVLVWLVRDKGLATDDPLIGWILAVFSLAAGLGPSSAASWPPAWAGGW
jgi:hypothetical protein